MWKTACAVLMLLLTTAASAAEKDATVKLYKDVLVRLRRHPGDRTATLLLRPPAARIRPAHHAAMDDIVALLRDAADGKPNNFNVAYNYYRAVWNRYLYFGAEADSAAAFKLLNKAAKLTQPSSYQRAQCAYEYAENALAMKQEKESALRRIRWLLARQKSALAKKEKDAAALPPDENRDADIERLRLSIPELTDSIPQLQQQIGKWRDLAIERFIAARRAAMTKGRYAARSAFILGDLYFEKAENRKAKTCLREALDLDTPHGYITNQAYDRVGLVLLAEGNVEGAEAMLESAGSVKPDDDIRSFGFAHRLARALIESGTYNAPVAYLSRAVELADEGVEALNPDLVYALALGYTEMGNSRSAIMYWKRYLDMHDANEAQRRKAKEIVERLAIPGKEQKGR